LVTFVYEPALLIVNEAAVDPLFKVSTALFSEVRLIALLIMTDDPLVMLSVSTILSPSFTPLKPDVVNTVL
jgi:hypothetical protein